MPPRNRTKPSPFAAFLDDVKRQLEPQLKEVLRQSEAEARSLGKEVSVMVHAVRNLCLRGGKRLRPALCVAGALCYNPRFSWQPALHAGVSLELLQAYFLIHDDWMDQDSERRGGPTAHVELARALGSPGLGERSAILAGDHAIALASAHLSNLDIQPGRLKRCMQHFAHMQLAAVSGQQLDIVGKARDPELTYELKTASYTVRGPLLMGADLAGANKATRTALHLFSRPAGIAFQLRDDLIGVFGDARSTGKPRGSDLTAGKNTPLVKAGLKLMKPAAREKLLKVLGNSRATLRQLAAVTEALEDCGARARIELRIEELREEALLHLARGSLSKEGRGLLEGALAALTDRDA